jgi:hypothetical protein
VRSLRLFAKAPVSCIASFAQVARVASTTPVMESQLVGARRAAAARELHPRICFVAGREISGAVVSLPILPNARIGDYRVYEVLG